MKFISLLTAYAVAQGIAYGSPFFRPPFSSPSQQDQAAVDNGQKLATLQRQSNNNLRLNSLKHFGKCNGLNAVKRQEFRKMSKRMRKEFTTAVGCMTTKKSALNGNSSYPGVKNRYDDYPAAHMEFNQFNHFTGTFLSWHRYVIWTFEQELRRECGYTGYLPYWDWGLDAQQPDKAEIFNGDEYSMGSNGAPVPHGAVVFTIPLPSSFLSNLPNPQTNVSVPAGSGTGGGCISADGPFGKQKAHLGPTILASYGPATGPNNLFKYNPRCIKRDLNPYIMRKASSYRNITEAITNYTTVGDFQAVLQSDSRYALTIGNIGVHAGGHVGVGGEPMADQPSTPGDPIWFLHHASIDRMWSIWQNQDIEHRTYAVADTQTILNFQPSPNVTLDTVVDLAYLGGTRSPPRTVRELSSTVEGPFCYIYE